MMAAGRVDLTEKQMASK
jgi:hypothetical protein